MANNDIQTKLLLTSGGLRNPTLVNALLELAGKSACELKVAFIPTALNVEPGDKGWAIDQMLRLRDMGIGQIDIVDISATGKEVWLPRLEESNVIFVNGGNTTHLMSCITKSGLADEIRHLLNGRVYVGVSAGSYVATPDIRINNYNADKVLDGLGLVNFGLQVHLYSSILPVAISEETVRKRVRGCPYTVYALDDQMAVKVDGDNIEVVGEGKYLKFEPSEF